MCAANASIFVTIVSVQSARFISFNHSCHRFFVWQWHQVCLKISNWSLYNIDSGTQHHNKMIFFFCYQQFFFHTQHNIISKIKQNKTADTYSTPQGSIKREGRGKDNKNTDVTPPYNHVYSTKNTAKHQWSKAWPHRLTPLYIHMTQFAGGYGSNMFFYTCVV